ncbi:MAG: penicillin-binding protein 2 [Parcubacteria group bacterium]
MFDTMSVFPAKRAGEFCMSIFVKQKQFVKASPGGYCQLERGRHRDWRVDIVLAFFIAFFLLIVGKLFQLQVMSHSYYLALASNEHEIFQHLYPVRGTIYLQDQNNKYFPAATDQTLNLLFAVPKEVKDADAALGALKEVFALDEASDTIADWRTKLSKQESSYALLKHFVTDDQITQIKNFNLSGILWSPEVTRYYPEKNIGSQLLGFVGKQSESNILKGYYGLEACYDEELAGAAGFLRSESDALGRLIALADQDFREAKDGDDFYLTVDKSIEFYACSELNKALAEYNADAGSLVAIEPATGKILALCNAPDFDPNKYNTVRDMSVFNNSALTDSYEPGSVFKPLTMAAALDAGKVTPFSTYNDTGKLVISKYTIQNSDLLGHGIQTMTQVLEKSLNTGAVYAAQQVGLDGFKKYVQSFGFGATGDSDLCHEAAGNIKSLDDKNPIYLATASFGQGITVTPLQMTRAYAAIANGGKLMAPYVVDSIVDKSGNVIKKNSPRITTQVISAQNAKLLGSMMVSAVNNGYGKLAKVPGYLVAGKTGTAQVPDLVNGGYSDKTIHTFVGFMPFETPRLAMTVKLVNPKDARFAESTATPLWGKIAKFIMDYYAVPTEISK